MSAFSPAPAFLTPGVGEILVIAFVALLVFGGKLPDVMRNLGRAYANFRRGMSDLTSPIREEMRRIDAVKPSDTSSPQAPRYDAGETPPAAEDETPEAEPTTDTPRTPLGAADEPPPV